MVPLVRWSPRRNAMWAPALTAATVSTALASVVLRLWDADLRVPFTHRVDAYSVLAYVKTTLTHAWPLHESHLGAPLGQDLYDYPLGDPIQVALTKFLGLFSSDPALVANLLFLAGFPLAALVCLWSLRQLGVARWTATACSIIFALAPYHFLRGEDHLMVVAYYTVPLGGYLVVRHLVGDPPSRRTALIVAVLVGLGFTYYSAFTLLLLAPAVLIAALARRRTSAVSGAIVLAVMAGTATLGHLPTLIHQLGHGGNPTVASLHAPDQAERFGLKPIRLVLPVPDHRAGPLASLTHSFERRSPSQEDEGPPQSLGLIAAIGLAVALAATLLALAGREVDPRLRGAGAGAGMSIVLGASGGLALVVTYLGTDWLRSWNRLSIFIAWFALLALATVLDRLSIAPRLLAVVVAVAVLDQTSGAIAPDYDRLAAQWRADAAFVERIDSVMPSGASVYQLPYMPFPEQDYRQATPFLHSRDLRWSFGAMAGRPADWAAGLVGIPGDRMLPAVAAAGFSGVYLNRGLYPDGGAGPSRELRQLTGAAPLTTADGRQEFFDIRSYAQRVRTRLGPDRAVRLRELALGSVIAQPGPQLSALQLQGRPPSYGGLRWSYEPTAEFELDNPLPHPRRVAIAFGIRARAGGSVKVVATAPGARQMAGFGQAGGAMRLDARIPPGRSRLRIVTNIRPGTENLVFAVTGLTVHDLDLLALTADAAR